MLSKPGLLPGILIGVAGYWAFQHFSGRGNTGKSAGKKAF